VFEFIDREKSAYQVRFLCRAFKVSASGYYAWRCRPVCPRKKGDARLRELIVAIHARSRGTYGVARIRAELHYHSGVRCSGKRVFRLMRMLGIQGKRKRRKFKTTWRPLEAKPAPDLVGRNFVASRPDEVWVADIKYIRTREGFLYLGGVTDVFTRTGAGWAMLENLQTKLVEDALEMAILRRKPKGPVIQTLDRELLDDAVFHQSSRTATGRFQLHRELVQPVAPALLDREAVTRTVRACLAAEERSGGDGLSYDPIPATRPPKRVKARCESRPSCR
jgi:HTH-like domain/Integrase core domain